MATKIVIRIASILNCLPIFHVSEDEKFGSVKDLTNGLRLSIFSLPLGENKYYLFSFLKDTTNKSTFTYYKHLKFYDICKKESKVEIDTKADNYKVLISSHSKEEQEFQVDFLKEKTSQNQDRISIAYNKINNYAAINLVHIGFIGYLFTEILNIKNNGLYLYLLYAMLGLSFIYTLNYFLFIKFGLSIKEFARSTFKNLKDSPTIIQLATNYYTDWYSFKNEADIITSIVSNIEEYFIRSIYITFFLWIGITTNNNFLNKTTDAVPIYENENLINSQLNKPLDNYFPKFAVKIGETIVEKPTTLIKELNNNNEINKNEKLVSNKKSKNIKNKFSNKSTTFMKYKDCK